MLAVKVLQDICENLVEECNDELVKECDKIFCDKDLDNELETLEDEEETVRLHKWGQK